MGEAALLGIDLGTTAVKLGLFAVADGRQLALAVREYPLQTPHDRWAELDAEVYWQAIVAGMAELRRQAPAAAVAAIGLSSQGQTFVVLDEADRPLRPAIVWLDTRGEAQCRRLLAELGADAYRRHTGTAFPQPISSAPKLMWLAEHEPATWRRIRHVAMLPEFIGHRLTGRYACDPCNLGSSGLLGEDGWWDDALRVAGTPREWFGDVVPTGGLVGTLTPAAAAALGLPPGLPVGSGSNDQLTGAVGVANVRPGILSGAIGTAMALVATLPGAGGPAAPRLAAHAHAVPGLRFALTFAMTTGILLRWYRDKFGGGQSYDELLARAAIVPPGADGLTFLPHFSGIATPTFDATVKGGLTGLTLAHGPEHVVRALIEAVAFTVRDALELLGESYPTRWEVLRVLGGATRSPLWLQLIADVSGLPVERPACHEAAVFGAALAGGVAGGLLPDLVSAAERGYRVDRRWTPGPDRDRYAEPYRRYRQAMEQLYPGALGLAGDQR